jgi:F-type H+-transporting ATPase subunit b
MLEHETGFIFWELFTFALLVLLLRKLAWPPLMVALAKREREISSSLEKALANLGKAEETLRLERATVADRDRIIDAILRSAEQTSEELKQTLRALAEKQAEVAIEEAGKEIKRLERQAINDLRSEVSAMVVDVAGKLIDSELTNRHQSMLIDSAIMSLASVEA